MKGKTSLTVWDPDLETLLFYISLKSLFIVIFPFKISHNVLLDWDWVSGWRHSVHTHRTFALSRTNHYKSAHLKVEKQKLGYSWLHPDFCPGSGCMITYQQCSLSVCSEVRALGSFQLNSFTSSSASLAFMYIYVLCWTTSYSNNNAPGRLTSCKSFHSLKMRDTFCISALCIVLAPSKLVSLTTEW